MKRIVLIWPFVGLLAAPHAFGDSAPDVQQSFPVDVQGSFFSRYELRREFDALGASRGRFLEGDAAVYRARLGFTTRALKLNEHLAVQLQFTPQASGFLGLRGEPVTINDPALGMYEGYIRIVWHDIMVDVGRFRMNYGEAMIIGDLDWHQTGRAFEGARLRYQTVPSGFYVDTFVTQVREGRPLLEPGAGDTFFYGVYAGLGTLVHAQLALDLYALGRSWLGTHLPASQEAPLPHAPRSGAHEQTLGARLKQQWSVVDVRLESGVQLGTRPTASGDVRQVLAYQADGEVGLSGWQRRVRASVGALYASGDTGNPEIDRGWDELYPTAHKFLGLSDIMGVRTNIASANATLRAQLDPLIIKVDGHAFYRPQSAPGQEGYAGSEIDTHLIWVIAKSLTLRGMYGLFVPGSQHFPSDGLAHYLEVELRYDI